MIPGISPVLWDGLHELHGEGCPIDIDEMYRRMAPVHLENKLPHAVTPLLPLRSGFMLVLRLVLSTRLPFNLQRFEMVGDWLPAPVECFRTCRRHGDGLCAQSDTVHVWQPGVGPQLLNFGALPRYLEAGVELEGLLLGFCPTPPPRIWPDERLDLTVCARDAGGYGFRFPLVLQAGAAPPSPASQRQ